MKFKDDNWIRTWVHLYKLIETLHGRKKLPLNFRSSWRHKYRAHYLHPDNALAYQKDVMVAALEVLEEVNGKQF